MSRKKWQDAVRNRVCSQAAQNDELNVAVTNRGLAARLLTDFEQDLKSARRLDLQTWRQRSMLMKAREVFWSSFGEIF